MAWRRPCDKPLSEPMMDRLMTLDLNELQICTPQVDSYMICVFRDSKCDLISTLVNDNIRYSPYHQCALWHLLNFNTPLEWWRHQKETSALLALDARNSPVTGEFPAQRPVTRSFNIFFDVRLNKRLSKQSWGWWFETTSRSLWRHRNVGSLSRCSTRETAFYLRKIMTTIHVTFIYWSA